jgi:hypothetical protein
MITGDDWAKLDGFKFMNRLEDSGLWGCLFSEAEFLSWWWFTPWWRQGDKPIFCHAQHGNTA